VRKPTLYYNLLCIKKLLSNTYRQKVVRALSKYLLLTEDNKLCEVWTLNGKMHRENGPSFIERKGNQIAMDWCINGKLHNEIGPAIMDSDYDGNINQEWYINGKTWNFNDRTQYILSKYSKLGDHEFDDVFG